MYNKELAKENRIKAIAKVACAMLCLSLIGGYVYYVNSPAELQLRNEQLFNNDINTDDIDKIELTDWEKESIQNAMLEREEIEQKKIELAEAERKEPNVLQKSIAGLKGIATNTKEEKIQVWENVSNSVSILKKSTSEEPKDQKEGYDQMGHPYLKEGQSYTFSDNGLGAPNEAPAGGFKWGGKNQDVINPNTGEHWLYLDNSHWSKGNQKEAQAEIDEMQNREVGKMGNMTTEDAKKFVQNMTINMGSMK